MGGLSKKSHQIITLADKNGPPAILLDAGNLLFKQPTVSHSQELLTASGLMDIYQRMAFDAVAVGPFDLAAGIDFLKNDQFKNFPWLSANLTDKQHRLLFPATRVIERGAIKIGILGLTGQIAAASQEIIVADWRKVLPQHLRQLTQECQMIIVLSSLASEDNAELTQLFPEVHVLITADRQQGNIIPRVDNRTLVTQTMSQGKYLGMLDLSLMAESALEKDAPHLPGSFSGNFIPLSKNLPEDRQIAERIEAIKQQISSHNQKLAVPDNQPQNTAGNQSFPGLAGFVRCRECHVPQDRFWNSTKHAGAYATLQRQQQNFNLDCLPCHITRNPDAKQNAPSSIESLLTLPASLQSVGCEACHGPALAHADTPDKVKPRRKVEEKTCVVCHTKERDPAFDYRQKLPKVSCPAG